MKTVVLVGSRDTKDAEITYISDNLKTRGIHTTILDVTTIPNYTSQGDYSREQIAREAGVHWNDTKNYARHELLSLMCDGLRNLTRKLYESHQLDGIMAVGGLQNTTMGSAAMVDLPIGLPKIIVSTIASGKRTFDTVVGTKDIFVMPSPCDFTGITSISKIVLDNSIAAMMGMVETAGNTIQPCDHIRIGTTFMGATNDGVANAVEIMQKKGYEVVSFHSTGAGGKIMEELVQSDSINAIMDLTLHEIVYEYFGYGFGYCENKRLENIVEKGIPMLICPAGIDFMCQWPNDTFDDLKNRKYIWHNPNLLHVKLSETEVTDISRIIVQRLNRATGKIKVIIPTQGFRSYTKRGEDLYDEAVDLAIIKIFKHELRSDIPIKYIDANFMDYAFSQFVVEEMIDLLE